ncbi:MAG: DUF1415 domain-containing protein [Gammaproteobacteria bacterium]|nr:DUF1415 domain-containing protein [Gammaproteobacteria bacterium]MBU0786934.1 DUF1415 domain-containing protein [Gammaproteobacteria bacterium]MBU0813860.1 DUF1415 domain-containing protein [Gammaproteobacteria bacterium]MBU1788667.1 DUF1415 domain-containing protein [Gammaproteobacteria bacterium]
MRRWLERAVIGLNLCPFAKAVQVKGQIHYAVSKALSPNELKSDLRSELKALADLDAEVRDTTLLMAPYCLSDFFDFNDFLAEADQALVDMGLEGTIQIASFHPDYQFAGTTKTDISNATNQAPYPTLHLLREASIDKAVAAFPEPEAIFEQNMKTLEKLGHEGWSELDVGPSSVGNQRQEIPIVAKGFSRSHGKIKP